MQVPGVVKLAGLHHRTASRSGIATALEGQCGKRWFSRVTVVGVGHHLDHVVRAELLDHERTSTHRVEVLLGASRRFVTQALVELRFLQNRSGWAAKHVIRVGLGGLEGNAHGVVVHGGHFVDRGKRVGLGATLDARAVSVAEDHVLGRERRAVRPLHAFFQLVGDAFKVSSKTAIGHRGNFFHQVGHHFAFFVEPNQGLEHQRGALQLFGATRQIGVKNGRCLPVNQVDVAAGAALRQRRLGQRQGGAQR